MIGLLSDSAAAMQTDADVLSCPWCGPGCFSLILLLSQQRFDTTTQATAAMAMNHFISIPQAAQLGATENGMATCGARK